MDHTPFDFPIDEAVGAAMNVVSRVWHHDHTVWSPSPEEIVDRLGWLDAPARALEAEPLLMEAARDICDGVDDVVLVGMGGSSLYPAVLAEFAARGLLADQQSDADGQAASHRPALHVLDSTVPAAVHRLETAVDWTKTAVVAASKSGTTIETTSHLDRFAFCLERALGSGGSQRMSVITDPGSALAHRAEQQGFGQIVEGQADVGGRFSALTPFGLLPATVLGLRPSVHVASAAGVLDAGRSTDPAINRAAWLGAVMAAAADAGRNKLTLLLADELVGFGPWIEQLVAESTGKDGAGIVPILGDEPGRHPYGDDRLVVAMGASAASLDLLDDTGVPWVELPWDATDPVGNLAALVVTWELATAVACALMGVNPFDQPDVARAKAATQRALADGAQLPPAVDPQLVLDRLAPGDYLAILGYVAPGSADELALHRFADRIRPAVPAAVTVGIGPRYLHSTGQLHKGGPATGHFLVVVDGHPGDVSIPGQPYGFRQLVHAQAAGDVIALQETGRTVAVTSLQHLQR